MKKHQFFRLAGLWSFGFLLAAGAVRGWSSDGSPPLPPPPPDFNLAPRVLITSPAPGERFLPGTLVKVHISSSDPDGYVPTMELFVDGRLVDSETRQFLIPPPPGETHVFDLAWPNATEGRHKLVARATDDRGLKHDSVPVEIQVTTSPPEDPPVVTVRSLTPEVTESIPDRPGRFRISRTGSVKGNLEVLYELTGTAINGIDYHKLPGIAVIPAGTDSVDVLIVPIPDKAREGKETILLSLVSRPIPAIFPPPQPPYIVGSPSRAEIALVEEPTSFPVVTISATDPEAREGNPPNSGTFRIRRTGSIRSKLNVHYLISGTAENSVDYVSLPGMLSLSAGDDDATVVVRPLTDSRAEPNETVTLTLVPSPLEIFPLPPEEDYQVGSPSEATVTILDRPPANSLPRVSIVTPSDGATFAAGTAVEIKAEATDPDGRITKLALFVDNRQVAEQAASTLAYVWTAGPAGRHHLRAEATDDRGGIGKSPSVTVVVQDPLALSFVKRQLPSQYVPGQKLTVTLTAAPIEAVQVYAVLDRPPRGWSAANISSGGVFDPAARAVKFGPFFDNQTRVLTYDVVPPPSETGRKEFAGIGSANGTNSPIEGDSRIDSVSTRHPADNQPEDKSINAQELTAYSFAWKTGKEWPIDPNPIPQSYVTRAALIWQSGEDYLFDASQGVAPLWWIPKSAPPQASTGSKAISKASVDKPSKTGRARRTVTFHPQTGVFTVNIAVQPHELAQAYTLEERLPVGWAVAEVTENGVFNSSDNTLRWGVFLDGEARAFRYRLSGPPGPSAGNPPSLAGAASIDGVDIEIESHPGNRPAVPPGRVRSLRWRADGNCELVLTVHPGQRYRVQASTDLTVWSDLGDVASEQDEVQVLDREAGRFPARYYRLVPIE